MGVEAVIGGYYALALKNSTKRLILASFVVYGEWVNLAIVSLALSSMNILTVPTALHCFSFL